ncbi:MAG: GNAT family N-acetyltransferase [Candidatus Gottesmanbacteria bacterium]|nr:GNAT family N-acetyltransferase [Candidatus Gottesmanbacteria bacterium]
MKILKVDFKKEAKVLFALNNKAFYREFDLPSRSVQEQEYYLQGSDVYILYDVHIPVGFFSLKKTGVGIELESIVIVPEKQRKGFGKAMMNKILELTKGNTVHLATHPRNTGAIIFYLKFGFEIYGWKDNCYGDGQPRLLLRRAK